MERGGMEGPSTKLYKFFILLVHIISTIDPGMSSFFNMRKKRWELVDVWELKPIKMWQWVGENCIIVNNGICYDGYKIATTKIVLSINFTNAKWWKIIAQTRILNWFLAKYLTSMSGGCFFFFFFFGCCWRPIHGGGRVVEEKERVF